MKPTSLDFSVFVRQVVDALEAAGIDYLVGGAVAAWAWGEPRATLDLDLVVDIPLEAIDRFSLELEKRNMLVPPDIIMDNILEDRGDIPINATQLDCGYKADIYPLRANDALRKSALARRRQVDLGPPFGIIYLHSPEDLILYKLSFYNLSQQTKHLRDITAIVSSLGEELDYTYIRSWAEKKGLISLWREMLARIKAKTTGK